MDFVVSDHFDQVIYRNRIRWKKDIRRRAFYIHSAVRVFSGCIAELKQ